jgi:predicted GNAT family N-acyltransferase
LEVEVKRLSDCSQAEIKVFENVVVEAGEVQTDSLRSLIVRAVSLIFLYSDSDELAGIAAVKRPDEGYKRKVFSRANSPENPYHYDYELGWIVVRENYRGNHLSRYLVEAALRVIDGAKIYATTRATNVAMRRTNERYGFRVSGEPYPSSRRGDNYELLLFVRG